MSSSSANCSEFKPHLIRPDKCRKCFGDKSKHITISSEDSDNIYNEIREQQQSAAATSEQLATTSFRDNKIEEQFSNNSNQPTTKLMNDQELKKSLFEVEIKVNELNREQLIDELRRIFDEREKYKAFLLEKNNLLSSYESQIEQLKLELKSSTGEQKKDFIIDKEEETRINLNVENIDSYKLKCKQLEAERDLAREELKALEHEMEEMHDNFKEEESEQFEQVKQELDIALKNCKILQIRLNKAERQYSQLEQVKSMLERQLEDNLKQQPYTSCQDGNNDDENISASPASFIQCGTDFVKLSTSEYDQLLRDLNDTIERERDLQEQIKYSQEEAQLKGDRLQAAEAENEVLLSKVNKLTTTNSKLRSTRTQQSIERISETIVNNNNNNQQHNTSSSSTTSETKQQDLFEQNEQLKLALDLAQSECERLRANLRESHSNLELKENTLKNIEQSKLNLEDELTRLKASCFKIGQDNDASLLYMKTNEQFSRLELECRQLRSKLVRSERECKQLKAQLDNSIIRNNKLRSSPSSSFDHNNNQIDNNNNNNNVQQIRQLKEELDSLSQYNKELLKKNELLETNKNVVGQTIMEKDLLEKLKHQLNLSENELANTKSRLVEINMEHSQLQRQYKRLMESIESTKLANQESASTPKITTTTTSRKAKLPPETMRDTMSRQELRQAIKDLELEIAEWMGIVKLKDCLIKEFHLNSKQGSMEEEEEEDSGGQQGSSSKEQQLFKVNNSRLSITSSSNDIKQNSPKTLFTEQKRIANDDNIINLEKQLLDLQTNNKMFERERVSMEEELDKLRQVNQELRLALEESKKVNRLTGNKLKDLQVAYEKIRKQSTPGTNDEQQQVNSNSPTTTASTYTPNDVMLMARDLTDLKVKNSFLMRQLEMANEDTSRQLDDQRQADASQLRRAVELAQLELKELHLTECQSLRDELNDLKQKLSTTQKQLARSEEDVNSERDRLRSLERDWRRDKSQWLQRTEQLESQLTIEKRSNEIKIKESESLLRYKDRELINVQDKCVQLERDLKRMQNKYNLLEENSESKQKQLTRDLNIKKNELNDLINRNQSREDEYYDNCKRFNKEKTTLLEALESIKRTYDEKLVELKSVRELLLLRQDQSYKERQQAQDKIDQLSGQLMKLNEHETQTKLLQHQNSIQEKQIETIKRELIQLKEDRMRLKTKNDELERKCQQYEKQELINKTTSISASSTANSNSQPSFLKGVVNKNIFSPYSSYCHSSQKASKQEETFSSDNNKKDYLDDRKSQCQMIEKLSSKISDQRHLINLLKQQVGEAQCELKQLKLLHSSERNKWQIKFTQLTSKLNECEEKLLFETSQLLSKEMFDNCKKKIELKWNDERQTTAQLLQQQQQQNDILMKDLKKLNQSYDLLRLQSKQLESQNNRLSRKLIEYQQSSSALNVDNDSSIKKLNDCLTKKRELENKQAQLERLNAKLIQLMEEETRPLVETVTKIVASLDGTASDNKQASIDSTTEKQLDCSSSNNNNKSNSLHRPLMTNSPTPPTKNDTAKNDLIETAQPAHQIAQQQNRSRLSRFLGSKPTTTTAALNSSSTLINLQQADSGSNITKNNNDDSSKQTKTVKKVRVKSSTLGITPNEKKQLKKHLQELSVAISEINLESKKINSLQQEENNKTTTKILQYKSSTRSAEEAATDHNHNQLLFRASSEVVDRNILDHNRSYGEQNNNHRSPRGTSYTPTRTTTSMNNDSSPQRTVHWGPQNGQQSNNNYYDQSDLDSERSWSASNVQQINNNRQSSTTSSNNNSPHSVGAGSSSDSYRRFPQTTPASYFGTTNIGGGAGASLTDYDSETSLASECSTYSMGAYKANYGGGLISRGNLIGGAESDSCMETGGGSGRVSFQKVGGASSGSSSSKRQKATRGGLKLRLTNTLRNISRSITSVGHASSDTEDLNDTMTIQSKKNANDYSNGGGDEDEDDGGGRSKTGQIREIRV